MKPVDDDEIVAEVRRVRAKIFQECGGTLEGLYARLKELEKKETRQILSLAPRPPQPLKTKAS
jgi:hypothetical protein